MNDVVSSGAHRPRASAGLRPLQTAAHPELMPFAQDRLGARNDSYLGTPADAPGGAPGDGVGHGAEREAHDDLAFDGFASVGRLVDEQVTRRLAAQARAAQLSKGEMTAGAEAEKVERQLSDAA